MKTEWEAGASIQDSAITEEKLQDYLCSEIEHRAGVCCPKEVIQLLPKKEDLVVIETRCSLPASGGHGIGYGPMYISRDAAVKAGHAHFVECEYCHSHFDRTSALKCDPETISASKIAEIEEAGHKNWPDAQSVQVCPTCGYIRPIYSGQTPDQWANDGGECFSCRQAWEREFSE